MADGVINQDEIEAFLQASDEDENDDNTEKDDGGLFDDDFDDEIDDADLKEMDEIMSQSISEPADNPSAPDDDDDDEAENKTHDTKPNEIVDSHCLSNKAEHAKNDAEESENDLDMDERMSEGEDTAHEREDDDDDPDEGSKDGPKADSETADEGNVSQSILDEMAAMSKRMKELQEMLNASKSQNTDEKKSTEKVDKKSAKPHSRSGKESPKQHSKSKIESQKQHRHSDRKSANENSASKKVDKKTFYGSKPKLASKTEDPVEEDNPFFNGPTEKVNAKTLFGESDDSDWDDLAGDEKSQLSKEGKEMKKLLVSGQRQRQAHAPNFDPTTIKKPVMSRWTVQKQEGPKLNPETGTVSGKYRLRDEYMPKTTSLVKEDERESVTDPFCGIRIVMQGEYCTYHVQSMYKKSSAKRQELQASTGVTPKAFGGGKRTNKDGCFFYGGNTYSTNRLSMLSVPSAGSMNFVKHLVKKDATASLSGKDGEEPLPSKSALDLLQSHKKDLQQKQVQQKRQKELLSVQLAIAKIKAKGGISKEDPNAVVQKKLLSPEAKEKIKKRVADDMDHDECPSTSTGAQEPPKKKSKLLGDLDLNSPEVQQLLKKKSKHTGALAEAEAEQEERYFGKLEQRERMEDKMASIKEMDCKYRSKSLHDRCKKEHHNFVKSKGTQRFFKCKQCKTRTICFDKMPTKACKDCGSFNFERVSMYQEKKGPTLESEELCLRGNEQKYLGSLGGKSFLNA
ncbi:MCM10-like protein [Mya arenaria]|uniref:MCM10-like protein n=1 Tax=Mya arenaria TaxID=6604 RepID=A0ABY7FY31_MYAAR|nr:MCM10-like protein [Mya arenaria]